MRSWCQLVQFGGYIRAILGALGAILDFVQAMKVLFGPQERDSARRWQTKTVWDHQAAQILSAKRANVFGLAVDGTPVGSPKAEYLLSMIWTPELRYSAIGTPVTSQ